MNSLFLSWSIAAAATVGVIVRPFKWPEAVWAVGGAVLLVALGLLPVELAIRAVSRGSDVYLFLTGMMLLSEVGRSERLFDWVAVLTVNHARGSPRKLFLLVYLAGMVITAFLSNDATAVVLTPAVFVAAKKAKTQPLPLLFVCAFIANAASFVLPISNPANLVLYGNHTPALGIWLMRFTVPSLVSLGATYTLLRWTQREALSGVCGADLEPLTLPASGRVALAGIAMTAVALLTVSAFDIPLGMPTATLGALTATVVLIQERKSPLPMLREISWSVLPLVAALFVLVETLVHTGAINTWGGLLQRAAQHSELATAASAGGIIAIVSNLINNLPAGLIASTTVSQAHVSERTIDALLIGVDLGPNLSITGSLATILWLNAIRREGEDVSFMTFLKVGAVVMLPTLALALFARIFVGQMMYR